MLTVAVALAPPAPTFLLVEGMIEQDAVAVDVPQPLLSWTASIGATVSGTPRGLRQVAFQVSFPGRAPRCLLRLRCWLSAM